MSPEDFLECLSDDSKSEDDQLDAINAFKAHVKRELVDLQLVPRYLDALLFAVASGPSLVSLLGFNVLSHLVKRVSMQNLDGSVLQSQSSRVLPVLFLRLNDIRSLTRGQAKRALEAYYFAAADQVESSLVDFALKSNDPLLISESVRWLEYIIRDVNQYYDLSHIKPFLFELMIQHPNTQVSDSILDLLYTFYSLPRNHLAQHTLAHEMESRKIPLSIILEVMLRITGSTGLKSSLPSHESKAVPVHTGKIGSQMPSDPSSQHQSSITQVQSSIPHTLQAKITHPLQSSISHPALANASIQDQDMSTAHESAMSSIIHQSAADSSAIVSDSPFIDTLDHSISDMSNDNLGPKLKKLLANVHYDLDPHIVAENASSSFELESLAQTSNAIFQGKETEFNWAEREKAIVRWRRLLRGDAPHRFSQELLLSLRDLADGICKAITSLRTTLSTHGCQLVKECAIILRSSFDSMVELVAPLLVKLCSATKSIASNNANMALCAIYANSNYNHKLLQRVYAASNDKNVLPRQYSTIWLQIILIRFSDNHSFSTPHGASNITGSEVTTKVLTKLLADANATVRQLAKECYWCFFDYFPRDAEQLLTTLEPKVSRIVEKARPGVSSAAPDTVRTNTILPRKPYISIKQLVIEKNRELRAKQREQTSASLARSRFASDSLVRPNDRLARLGAPKRVATMPLPVDSASMHRSEIAPGPKSLLHSDPVLPTATAKEQRLPSTTPFHRSASEQPAAVAPRDPPEDDPRHSIGNLLSSNETRLVQEGIEQLKLAILNGNDISHDVLAPLYRISVREPNLLSPLLLATDSLFRKSAQLFSHTDFFRVCCILQSPIEQDSVDQIILVMQVDLIHDSIIQNLSYAISTRNILDDDNLSMQFIKYLSTIIRLIIDFLVSALERIPISDSYLSKLCSLMFELVPMLQTTEAFGPLSQVLKKLHGINPHRFASQMILLDPRTKAEVDAAAEIDHTLDMNVAPFPRLGPISDLRPFAHPNLELDNISPVKVPAFKESLVVPDPASTLPRDNPGHTGSMESKVTDSEVSSKNESSTVNECMIGGVDNISDPVPTNEGELADSTQSPSEDKAITAQDRTIDHTADESMGVSQLNTDHEPFVAHEGDETDANNKRELSSKDTDTHAPIASLSSPKSTVTASNDFIDDFASVNIEEPSRLSRGLLHDLVHKMDPLKPISNHGQSISIFEDTDNSPQKVKAYSYSELNWFNYHLTKLAHQSAAESPTTKDHVAVFKHLCGCLSDQSASGDALMALLTYLQFPALNGAEFQEYIANTGYPLLQYSLKGYFKNVSGLTHAGTIGGLILIKQMLISKYHLTFKSVWSLLLRISDVPHAEFEMTCALTEVFQEALTGIYTSRNLLEVVLDSLNALVDSTPLTLHQTLVLKSLSTLLAMNSVEKLIKPSIANLIAENVNGYLSSTSAELRRLAIVNYAQLVKISRHHEPNSDPGSLPSQIGLMMSRLTITQRKLVEYYSEA